MGGSNPQLWSGVGSCTLHPISLLPSAPRRSWGPLPVRTLREPNLEAGKEGGGEEGGPHR